MPNSPGRMSKVSAPRPHAMYSQLAPATTADLAGCVVRNRSNRSRSADGAPVSALTMVRLLVCALIFNLLGARQPLGFFEDNQLPFAYRDQSANVALCLPNRTNEILHLVRVRYRIVNHQ